MRSAPFVLLSMLLSAGLAGAAATRPSTSPAAHPEQIRQWMAGLFDFDAPVRSQARYELMGLSRDDLPLLKSVLGDLAPLENNLETDLREIVTHVYLREAAYNSDPAGFLGIRMPPMTGQNLQVQIQSRIPGFSGYRALQDGDVILGIVGSALPEPLQREEFVQAIRLMRPGRQVHLKILRQGREATVTLPVDARPADRSDSPVDYERSVGELMEARQAEAQRYWTEHFGPLFR